MSATNRGGNRDRLDRYYTPDDLAETLVSLLTIRAGECALEPSAGGGAFARALIDRGCRVCVVDVDPGAPAFDQKGIASAICGDYLAFTDFPPGAEIYDWVIGNPPYGAAEAHVRASLKHARNVAFLLRLGFLESAKRIPFWKQWKPRKVWVLAERPSFTGGGTDATAYGFFWWDAAYYGETTLDVISWRGKGGAPLAIPAVGSSDGR